MKFYNTIFICILLLSICFSKTRSITIDTPYQTGFIVLNALPNHDTVIFSNGITLFLYSQNIQVLEPPPIFTGIAIQKSSAMQKAGFKLTTNSKWMGSGASDNRVSLFINSDTNWIASKIFPDTLINLEPLTNSPPDSQQGKWLFSSFHDIDFGTNTQSRADNYNTILYVQSNQNKMKIQFSDIFITEIPHTPRNDTRVDSLKMHWMVDSLGNGVFNVKTKILKQKNYKVSPSKNLNLKKTGYFNVNGQKIIVGQNHYIKIKHTITNSAIVLNKLQNEN